MESRGRVVKELDEGWFFHKGRIKKIHKKQLDEFEWQQVQVPHDWDRIGPWDKNAKSGTAGGYAPAGYGYYKRSLTIPKAARNKRITLLFDGIYMRATIWINGKEAGFQLYGYGSFEVDITNFVNYGKENELLIEVDNHKQPNCRWYSGSGIYRQAWLIITDNIFIPYGGLFVYPFNITEDSADIRIITELQKYESSEAERINASGIELEYQIIDPDAKTVNFSEKARTPKADNKIIDDAPEIFELVANLDHPILWSTEKPNLYTIHVIVKSHGKILDNLKTTFGIRTILFNGSGFYVNGKFTLMKGVCLHHDGGCVGAAVPKAVWRRRLKILKSMGGNAIRTSHNPPAANFLDLCDELGFLVIDEAFDKWPNGSRLHDWIRYGWKKYWYKELTTFIRRDRNHPSIVLWSLGNEVGRASSKKVKLMMSNMRDIVRRLDPTRPVTTVISPGPAKREAHRTKPLFYGDVVDVICTNYTESYLPKFHEKWPHKACLSTEAYHYWRRRHPDETDTEKFPPKAGHVDYTKRNPWWDVEIHNYIAGQFLWTGMEYLGEIRDPWPYHGRTNAPIRINGFKKPQSAFHETVWRDDPVVKVLVLDEKAELPRGKIHFDYPKVVWHWNFEDHEDSKFPVLTYTNCDEVELILNEKSLGKKSRKDYPMNDMKWMIDYKPGKLRAIGFINGEKVSEDVLQTSSDPIKIKLTANRKKINADGHDCAHIVAEIIDKNGIRHPHADQLLKFSVSGVGRQIGLDSGDLSSHESYVGKQCHAFHGRALLIVQSEKEPGTIEIIVSNEKLGDSSISINVE